MLNDSRLYMEQHFLLESQKGIINYHNWFFYELVMHALGEANDAILNRQWLDRYLSHPFNALQYY